METAIFHRMKFSHLISRWLVLFTVAHFSHHLLTALSGPLLPFMRSEFNLDYARSGVVLSVFSITYGLSQLPGGWLADRLGGRRLITIGIIGVAATGAAIYLTHSFVWLLILLGLMGFLGGGYHPAAPPLVCATMPPGKRGQALGIHAIGGSAAFVVAPLVVAATAAAWGWRSSYLALAVPALVFGLILYVLLRRFKSETAAEKPKSDLHLSGRRRTEFIIFVVLSAMGTIGVGIAVAYLPLLLVDHFDVSEGSAAALLAVVYFVGIFANMTVGFLTDHFSRRGILIAALLTAAAAIAILNFAAYAWGVVALLIVYGLLVVVLQNVAESYIMTGVARERVSSVLGSYYFTTMAGTGLFTPVIGALIDRQGFPVGYGVMAAVLGAAGAAYWLMKDRKRS